MWLKIATIDLYALGIFKDKANVALKYKNLHIAITCIY